MAGWANAAARRHGDAKLLTTEGLLDPKTALTLASTPARESGQVPDWRQRLPEPVVTLVKDARRIARNWRFDQRIEVERWRTRRVPYVFQLHGLFCDAGIRLAAELDAPSVLVVDACQVEEAQLWGVQRPGWAWLAERFGEWPQLRNADLVACVSEEVAASVTRHTGRVAGVEVVPNGVDTEQFAPGPARDDLRRGLGLEGSYVVGWSGSFRTFHGLDGLLAASAALADEIPTLALLLVGDGFQREAIAEQAREFGVRAVFPGTVPYSEVPDYLRLMDVAVTLAPRKGAFHYSPVKLREYQACGLPVIASAAGEMARDLRDADDALLVDRGDVAGLADAIRRLHSDRENATAIGERARRAIVSAGSWQCRLGEVERLLGIVSSPPSA
jgi:glycosyltransferase involved in cell wall biosynthesis